MNYIAFDYGKRFIGMAVGQSVTKTAKPLGTVINGQWQLIDRFIAEWRPLGLVVGIPLLMDGKEQWITSHARDFADSLRARYDVPVYEVDERLSSVEAREALFSEGGYRALKKEAIDAMAAKFILETWLGEL
jgi:putative Holliday junction resolvase